MLQKQRWQQMNIPEMPNIQYNTKQRNKPSIYIQIPGKTEHYNRAPHHSGVTGAGRAARCQSTRARDDAAAGTQDEYRLVRLTAAPSFY